MCGIAGFWDTKQASTEEQLQLITVTMRDTMLHRGPDSAGTWIDAQAGIALGHRRLAIIDLSAHGHQPMVSNSQRYVITYNGEIYNHLELKQQLGSAFAWRGHSDTEIMLAAFETWGVTQAVKKFVGMFAIALWDTQERLLYLIRDRMGEKPLYYGWLGNNFVFGSELKSLKVHPAWQQAINPDAVSLFMRYNCIPAPYTIYENIRKLEPGHILIINHDKHVRDTVYWDLKSVITEPTAQTNFSSDKQAIDVLELKLSQAVKQQMQADVPLGAFLSGGIDSSTIVALMQAQSPQPIKTFTIGFEDANYNEAVQAKAIAKHLNTQHTELYLSAEQARAIIPDLSTFYDEPFADASQLPTYMVAKMTREHVTVSLSGDGGDELFAGYNRYTWVPAIWRRISFLPAPMRFLLTKLLQTIPPAMWDKIFVLLQPLLPDFAQQRNPGDKMHKLASILDSATPHALYHRLISHWHSHEGLVPQANHNNLILKDLTREITAQPLVESMMYMDSQRYLPDDILVKVDRAAMAVSLETRIPFLDHRVVEFAWSLPLGMKIRNGQSKWILRQLLERHVPRELFERPKMGFGVPIDTWLRGPLKEWASDLLSKSMLDKHSLLDARLVQKKWQEHLSGTRNWQYHLWDVLMFQAWYEKQNG
jgi:asparagine synthase (glutamine-hydrolysing)